jgi:hypothetical protein
VSFHQTTSLFARGNDFGIIHGSVAKYGAQITSRPTSNLNMLAGLASSLSAVEGKPLLKEAPNSPWEQNFPQEQTFKK